MQKKQRTRTAKKEKPVEERSYIGKVKYYENQFYNIAKACKTDDERIDLFLEYVKRNVQLETDTLSEASSFAILARNLDPKIASLNEYFSINNKIKRSSEEQANYEYLYNVFQNYEKAKNNLKEKPNDIWYNKKGSNFSFAMAFKRFCDAFDIPCEVLSGYKEVKYQGELGQMTQVFGHRINKVVYHGYDAYVDIDALLKARDEGKDLNDYRITSLQAWKELNPDRDIAPDNLSVFKDENLKYYNWVRGKEREALKKDVEAYSAKTKGRVC